MTLVRSDAPRADADPAALAGAVRAVTAFSADLYRRVAARAGNAVCSPYSVAVALAMATQGARGETAEELLAVLHSPDASRLATGLSALDLALATRAGAASAAPAEARRIDLAGANSLWGQRGIAWQPAFLDVLAESFGTGMREVDYAGDTEQARLAVNAWVAEQTRDRIPDLLARGVLTADTRLTLVNALYLKAPWQKAFDPIRTRTAPFTRLDGSLVDVDLMSASLTAGYAAGPGWVAVDLPYARGELAMAVVVPDAGRFAEVEQSLDADWLGRLCAGLASVQVRVELPRWTMRTQVELTPALGALGLHRAFGPAADFSGMTAEAALSIAAVVHEGWIAVDEAGTEAAAATAVLAVRLSAMAEPELSVVADRPFLYVIHDRPTGTPLFLGRVLDPTAR